MCVCVCVCACVCVCVCVCVHTCSVCVCFALVVCCSTLDDSSAKDCLQCAVDMMFLNQYKEALDILEPW